MMNEMLFGILSGPKCAKGEWARIFSEAYLIELCTCCCWNCVPVCGGWILGWHWLGWHNLPIQHLQVSAGCGPAQSPETPVCMSPRPTVSLRRRMLCVLATIQIYLIKQLQQQCNINVGESRVFKWALTSGLSLVHSYFAVGQSSKEERLRVFEAEDWTAVRVHHGQQALNSCVHTAVHMDAGKTRRHVTLRSWNAHTRLKRKMTLICPDGSQAHDHVLSTKLESGSC